MGTVISDAYASDSKLLFRYQAKHPPLFNVGKSQA
jgi:hypothetical protein